MIKYILSYLILSIPLAVLSQSVVSDKLVHDFGTVKFGEVQPCFFEIQNISDSVVNILKIKGSSTSVLAECPVISLKPNQKTLVKVVYDSKKEGPINKSIIISLSDTLQDVLILRIRGEVIKND